jgi:hypothetical protein
MKSHENYNGHLANVAEPEPHHFGGVGAVMLLFILKKLTWYIVGQEPEPHQKLSRSQSRIKMMRLRNTDNGNCHIELSLLIFTLF